MIIQYETLLLDIDERGIATLTLNRPKARNALNKELIRELTQAIAALDENDSIRGVVLTGSGDVFCAGGDLRWMQDNMRLERDGRIRESQSLADLLHAMNTLSKPLIGRINGSAFGGALGLISVCDIAIGVNTSKFALTEVKLGLIAATISPYVITRMGAANARRTMLTAKTFTSQDAIHYGLLHDCVEPSKLDDVVEEEIKSLLHCSPNAVAATKKLICYVDTHSAEENRDYTATALADAWESPEGQEGTECFFEKTKPSWIKKN